MFTIVPITPARRETIDAQIAASWSGPYIVSRGILHDTREQDGFAAVEDGAVVGFALCHVADGECELTALESMNKKRGIGSALIRAVAKTAKKADCRRIWLVTTNDNTHAIRFYQRRGMSLCAVHLNAMDAARVLKPQIPLLGEDDIPLQHEFEFEMRI